MPTASMRASFVTATLLASAFGFTTLPAQASPGHGESIGAPAKSNPATRTINVELGDTFFKPTARGFPRIPPSVVLNVTPAIQAG